MCGWHFSCYRLQIWRSNYNQPGFWNHLWSFIWLLIIVNKSFVNQFFYNTKMVNVPHSDHTTNYHILEQVNVLVRWRESLLSVIKDRKISWFGHVFHHDTFQLGSFYILLWKIVPEAQKQLNNLISKLNYVVIIKFPYLTNGVGLYLARQHDIVLNRHLVMNVKFCRVKSIQVHSCPQWSWGKLPRDRHRLSVIQVQFSRDHQCVLWRRQRISRRGRPDTSFCS